MKRSTSTMITVLGWAGLAFAGILLVTAGQRPVAHIRDVPDVTPIPLCVHEAVQAPCYVRWDNGHSVVYLDNCDIPPTTLDVECVEVWW